MSEVVRQPPWARCPTCGKTGDHEHQKPGRKPPERTNDDEDPDA